MRVLAALLLVAQAWSALNRGDVIPGEYVVVLKKDVSTELRASHMSALPLGAGVVFEYTFGGHFPAYAVKGVSAEGLAQLQALPEVDRVVPNVVVTIASDLEMGNAEPTKECRRVDSPSWGLQRTSLRGRIERPIDSIQYAFDNNANGQGIEIHVQDTGIFIEHEDFEGRAVWAGDWTLEGPFDGHGHGTHVASTAGGRAYGLARRAQLFACKVMTSDGFGTLFSILGGLDFSARAAASGKKVVINMSLGALWNPLLNEIADDVVRRGTVLVAAAGNSNADACATSPASAPLALSVGSSGGRNTTDRGTDIRSDFSNWGTCVHIFAPGGLINAAWIGDRNSYRIASGTSMACPHGAGVAAKLWSANPTMTNTQVRERIIATAQPDLLRREDLGTGSPNRMLYMGCD